MNLRLNRLTEVLTFSLFKSFTFISLLFPFLKHFLSKTLDLFSMDAMLFDYDDVFDRPLSRPQERLSDIDHADQLYLVHYRWWNEARESLFSSDVTGVLYATRSSLSRAANGWDGDELDPEIVMDMRRDVAESSEEGGSVSVSGCEYALVLEWMFLRALKWHNDLEEVGTIVAAGYTMQDLFSLKIRLSFVRKTNVLFTKICQKDNEAGAFNKACNIFCLESGLFRIWDFSGQITQFCMDSRKLSDDLVLQNEETLLELQVYKLPYIMKGKEWEKNEMVVDQFKNEDSFASGSLEMNGSKDVVNSNFRVDYPPFASRYREACVMGLTGLLNLGNTCFMNSAVQCLVHTPKIVDYFLGDFRKDLNFENPLGMNGKLALAFGDLLRKLWAPGARPVAPSMFKSALSGFAPQFSGYNQHDSQEFLAFLLDGLHEDLNRVKVKPYIEVKDADDHPDEEVADKHWSYHLARNNSIIVDVCQGQFRSTLVCPICKKLSITFDPFMYLSLPLPSTSMRTMTLTVLSTDGSALPVPITITVPKFGRCEDLVQAVSTSCSLREDEMLLVAEIFGNRIICFLDKPADSIELIRDYDRLVAYRLPKDSSDTSHLVVFMHQHQDTGLSSHAFRYWKRFGIPLLARMSDISKGSEIRKQFLKLLDPFLMSVEDSLIEYDDALNTGNDDANMKDVSSAVALDGDVNNELEDVDVNSEFDYDQDVENDFQFFLGESEFASVGPKIQMNEALPISSSCRKFNVIVSWSDKMIELYDTALLSSLPEICKPAFLAKKLQETVSLYECLEAFLKEEPLGPEDMWYCPKCKEHRQASKKLDLWRLPEILVIHLKRFSYNRIFKNKLETFVDFPIEDLDLWTYTVHKSSKVSHRYVLYAISNHYGSLGGGHYTAFVQHGHNRWYEFDDSCVFTVGEEQIKTSAAYVLFYRRV